MENWSEIVQSGFVLFFQFLALLGIVARDCPTNPVSEVLPIRRCQEDSDCWPRICCPDGEKHFCRTPMPLWANARPLARKNFNTMKLKLAVIIR